MLRLLYVEFFLEMSYLVYDVPKPQVGFFLSKAMHLFKYVSNGLLSSTRFFLFDTPVAVCIEF